jgi:hypothetical protein
MILWGLSLGIILLLYIYTRLDPLWWGSSLIITIIIIITLWDLIIMLEPLWLDSSLIIISIIIRCPKANK